MNEKWVGLKYKDIDFSSKYEISNLGKVRNKETKQILKTYLDKDGYVLIALREPGTTGSPKCMRIHRLLMWNFVKQCDLEIDHIDMNKQNNDLSNLQYVSHIENQNRLYKSSKGRNIDKTLKKNAKQKRIPVVQYSLDGEFVNRYESILSASKNNNINSGLISNCLRGKNKTGGGYIWKSA